MTPQYNINIKEGGVWLKEKNPNPPLTIRFCGEPISDPNYIIWAREHSADPEILILTPNALELLKDRDTVSGDEITQIEYYYFSETWVIISKSILSAMKKTKKQKRFERKHWYNYYPFRHPVKGKRSRRFKMAKFIKTVRCMIAEHHGDPFFSDVNYSTQCGVGIRWSNLNIKILTEYN